MAARRRLLFNKKMINLRVIKHRYLAIINYVSGVQIGGELAPEYDWIEIAELNGTPTHENLKETFAFKQN